MSHDMKDLPSIQPTEETDQSAASGTIGIAEISDDGFNELKALYNALSPQKQAALLQFVKEWLSI
jgi:hypothetical protein